MRKSQSPKSGQFNSDDTIVAEVSEGTRIESLNPLNRVNSILIKTGITIKKN